MSQIILIHLNVYTNPPKLIGVADNFHTVDLILIEHMNSTYPAYKPKLIFKDGVYKIGLGTSHNHLTNIHYSTELCTLNERRL